MLPNGSEMVALFFAAIQSGLYIVPINWHLTGPEVAYILADSECTVVFAEDAEQVGKLRAQKAELPHLQKVVVFEDGVADGDWVIGLTDLGQLGEKLLADHPERIDEIAAAIRPESLATLIYTSGTTGRPKGVRLRHEAWTFEGAVIQAQGTLREDDLQFLWLPMAHSFGKVLLSTQLAIGFPTAVDGRVDKIIDNLAVVRPTFMGAAPRIFEKAHARIVTMQEAEGGVKEKIFKRAFAVGLEVERLKREGRTVPAWLGVQHKVFDRLVFAKIRERFGGRVRFFISGAAALNRDIAEWFHAAGILILEGYGLTETSAGAFVNKPEHYKFGTVGPVFPGSEVKLGEGDEILIKGPNVMEGYHNLPEETAKALTEDGWLHTGDKGSLDEDGFLTITGRIKDLFKTSGGKYIAPSAVEAKFKAVCPYASQFIVFGSERNYCVALVTLDPDAMAAWAQDNGMAGASYAEVVASGRVQAMVGEYVQELNAHLNRWETIKKWELLDHDLSVESGELTPSMKVKRNVVEDNHRALIDAMYP
jgi:long-chain acyl-CoA synthetase